MAVVAATTGTATIVVTDLVGSTPLRSALGEHAADDLRREHDAALTAVVTAHRGRVVKGAGDGVLAAFESASDAVAAAVEMQRTVFELGRRRRVRLAMRVGISAGDVSWEDGDCFGLPVVEAARLEEAAEPGRILCAGIVRALARGRAGVDFGSEADLNLHGLAEPVVACEIFWSPPEVLSLPEVLPLVGRTIEMGQAMAAWERATAGSGGAVLVAGEPGIGKTRLVQEVASRVAASGGTVWWGTAYEGEGRAYGPVTEMLEAYVRATEPAVLADQLGVGAGLVARLAPALRDTVEVPDPVGLSAEAERERTVDAVVDFAAAAASTAPLLVVVDDAHWADAATVGLFRSLVRRTARLPLLVVVAYRDTDLDRRHPLADVLPAWRRQPSVFRLPLRGLDRDMVGELVAAVVDDDVPGAVVSAISAETDGNPLFVREVTLHLYEEGRLGQPDTELGIPEGVREAIGRRLSRLSDETNRLLAVASAFDAGFDLGDAAAVAGLDDDAALDAIDEALGAQMVRPGDGFDRYQFAHALIRHTLWAELNPSRQVRLHRAIAEQIEKRTGHDPTPDESIALARHFHRSAALPGAERGVPYALVAADHAAARFAPAEEYQALAMALELLSAGDDRVGALHERAARAASLCAEWASAIDHARAAVDLVAAIEGPVAGSELGVALGRLAEDVETNAGWPFGHLVERHRATLDEAGETAVQLLAWEVAEAEYLDPDNPGIPVDSPERQRMNDLAGRLSPSQRPGGPGGYHWPSAAALLDDYQQGQTRLAVFFSFGGVGRYREAIDVTRRTIDELRAGGYSRRAVWLIGLLGRLRLILGDLDSAADLQSEGEQLLDRVEPGSNVVAQFEALSIMRAQFVDLDYARVLDWLEGLNWNRTDLRWVSGSNRVWHASLRAAIGHHGQALDELDANLPVVERACLGAPNYLITVHFAAQTLWSLRRADHLEVLERNLHAKILEPDFSYAESDGRWTAAILCALTGRYDEARHWFQQSHERLTAQEAILLLPHVCCDEALMEVRRGRRRDRQLARRRLDEARRWVDRIGLPNLLPRIEDLHSQLKS
jgi:class 3 adenylate cyclase